MFADERGGALQAALRAETAGRAAAVVLALEEAGSEARAGIPAAARSHHADFTVEDAPVTAASGLPAARRQLADLLGTGRDIRVEEIAISPRDGRPISPPAPLVWLRAEMVEEDETRERMAASLDEMQEMVTATLAYARGVSADQPTEPIDLATLLAGLAGELGETGPPVRLGAIAPATLPLRRVPIRRALRNLIENAPRYGNGATVGLHRRAAG